MLDEFLQHKLALRAKDLIENPNLFEELKELLVRETGTDGSSSINSADKILQQSINAYGVIACLTFHEKFKCFGFAYEDFYVKNNVKVIGMKEFLDTVNSNKSNINDWLSLL